MMRSVSPLSDDIRQKTGDRINDVAIDLLGLAAVARKAHWNVVGPLFGQLHDLFGKLYAECAAHADTLNEHVTFVLGFPVRGDHVEIGASAEADPIGDERDGLELCEVLFVRSKSTLAAMANVQREVQSLGNEEGFQLLLDASIAISKLGGMIACYLADEESESEREPKIESNETE